MILIKYEQIMTKYFVILMFLQEVNYSMVHWAQDVFSTRVKYFILNIKIKLLMCRKLVMVDI